MADWTGTSPAELLASHLNRRELTRRAYAADLAAFAKWLETGSPAEAVEKLVGTQRGQARRLLEDWKNHCRNRELSLATTRRRISSLLGLLSLAHEFEIIPWAIKIKLPAPRAVRDTRGPTRAGVDSMMEVCSRRRDAKGIRDHAILSLLYFSALRASEVLSIDLAGVDLKVGTVRIQPKGKWDKATIEIPCVTRERIAQWLERRGDWPGPLFVPVRGEAVDRDASAIAGCTRRSWRSARRRD